ncbi:hypothetical protein K493DRAFT_132170, partial [Basidiobolus meristosporus CBS 931.73]
QQEKVIRRKEHLQEVGKALQEGRLPTTNQINQGLEKLTENNNFHDIASDMSPEGKRMMANAERLVESAQILLAEKNDNDQLQNIIYHSGKAGNTMKDGDELAGAKGELSGTVGEAKDLASDGVESISKVAWLLVTSSQFRRLINDVTNILQETPVIGSSTGPHGAESYAHPHDLTQAQGVPNSVHHGEDREMMPGEARDQLRNTMKDSMAPVYFNAKETALPYVHKAEQGEISPLDAAVGVAKEVQTGLQQKVTDMRLTPDQRTHLIQRVKAIFREVQGNPDFQMAVDELLSVLSGLKDHGRHVTSSAKETTAAKHEVAQDDLSIARANAKELVENFAGQKSLDPLFDSVRVLLNKANQDHDLAELLRDIKTFVHRSIREYDYVDRPGYTDDANRIVERGHSIVENRYRGLVAQISDELSNFNAALKQDKTSKRFVQDLEAFTKDLFMDEFGKPTFKYDLVKDFARLIPIIAEKMDYVPLPRVEQSDEKLDVVLDNVVIQCSNILPKFVHINTQTVVDTNLKAEQNLRNKVYIKLSNVQVKVRDAAFYYRKKTFPKMTDVGYMDVDMPEEGIELDLLLNVSPEKGKKAHLYEVLDCNTRVHDLKLKIHGTRHSTTYKLLAPFINSKVKKVIQQMV